MADLQLFLLGAPRIELDGRAVVIGRKKAVALLAYLALTGRQHYRDWLVGLLWPEIAAGRTQLRIALSSLRKALGTEWLVTAGGKIGLSEDVWVDVNHFRTLTDQISKLPDNSSQRDQHLDEALDLYEYDLLAGFALRDAPEFDQWQRIEEEHLRSIFERLVHTRVNGLLQQHDFESAQTLVRRLIQIDPFNEPAQRQLMSLLVWTDQRPQALKSYEHFAALLNEQLGLEPEAETLTLYHHIQHKHDVPALSQPSVPVARERSYQLPTVDSLIGREQEVATILKFLHGGSRLLTITGPSGIGKTHLALYVAHQVQANFAGGCYFIPIDADVSATFLESALLSALNLHVTDHENMHDLLRNALISQVVLFVIDDFHRVADGVQLIQDILQVAPGATFLLTTYDQLTLKNEHCFPLQGLAVDQPDMAHAVELFVSRAQYIQPDFELTSANHAAIRRICQLLNGIPLGIILAAAWCDVLTPPAIARKLETNYDFLRVNHRDLPERHRSMRVLFDSTWMQQSTGEQQALMRLAVFQGGFSYEAAQTVAAVTLATIKRLVTKSIVIHEAGRNRYFIHDLLRQYALNQAHNRRDIKIVSRAYNRFYIDLVVNAEATIKGPLQDTAWHLIDSDLANVRAAWDNTLETGKYEALLPMIEPFRLYLQARGLWDQGRLLFEAARQRTTGLSAHSAQQVYMKTASRLYIKDDHTETTLRQALKLAAQFDDAAEMAHIHAELGWYWLDEADYQQAKADFEQALTYYTAQQDRYYSALVWRGLAYVTMGLGDRGGAMTCMRQSLAQRRAIGDWVGEHETLILRGELLLLQGFVAAACPDFETAFDFFTVNFSEQAALHRCLGLAWAYVFLAEYDQALVFSTQLLTLTPVRVMSPGRGTGIAVAALVYGLQADRAKLLHYAEELHLLLASDFQWPTKTNPDLFFFMKFVSGLTTFWLGRVDATIAIVRELTQTSMYKSPDHLAWIVPLVFLLSANAPDLADELAASLRSSEIFTLPWVRQWESLQTRLAQPPPPDQTARQFDSHKMLAAISRLDLTDPKERPA